MIDYKIIWNDLLKIRQNVPLVHNITNYVVMNFSANALLAIGASPVMAHAIEEVEEMTSLADALVINIGTLSSPWVDAMHKAISMAKSKNIPIILDPVGAGATKFRTDTVKRFLEICPPTILRGNASEILSLYKDNSKTKGVDSVHDTNTALEAAYNLSNKYNMVISISGSIDLIISDNKIIKVANGHPMMTRITGMGCNSSAITAAFAAVNQNYLHAAAGAMAVMGIAGEIATEKSSGTGSLAIQFLDTLSNLTEEVIKYRLKIL